MTSTPKLRWWMVEPDAGAWHARGMEPIDLGAFRCPRCGQEASEAYYGPCGACRCQLVATLGGDARPVEATDYEPKMNVTPNAVASKD